MEIASQGLFKWILNTTTVMVLSLLRSFLVFVSKGAKYNLFSTEKLTAREPETGHQKLARASRLSSALFPINCYATSFRANYVRSHHSSN